MTLLYKESRCVISVIKTKANLRLFHVPESAKNDFSRSHDYIFVFVWHCHHSEQQDLMMQMKVVRALNSLYGLELMSRTSPHSLTHSLIHNNKQQQNKIISIQSLNTICFLYNIRLEYHKTKNGNFPSSINYLSSQLIISAKTFNCFFYYSSYESIICVTKLSSTQQMIQNKTFL